jgi:hypothetical protein
MTSYEAILVIETGEDDTDLLLEAWQILIDEGVVWHLQGWYGRIASALISEGLCINGDVK